MIKHIDSTQHPLGGLHIICLSLLIFLTSSSHAMAATDDPDEDPYSDNDINVQHHGDTMVMTVVAWSVMVITLEVNDSVIDWPYPTKMIIRTTTFYYHHKTT